MGWLDLRYQKQHAKGCSFTSIRSTLVQSEEELPERLAGTVRFSHLRLKDAAYLDEESGKIYKGGQPV